MKQTAPFIKDTGAIGLLQTVTIPFVEFLHTVFDLHLVGPTQGVQLLYINELTGSSIRLAGIKLYGSLESYGLDHQLGQLADGQFLACAHIDVAITYLTQRRNGSTTSLRVVAVYCSIHLGTIEYRRILLYSDNIAEVNIEQHVHAGISHILAPQELTQRCSCSPEHQLYRRDAYQPLWSQ